MRYLVNLLNNRLTPDTDLFQASALDWLVESLEQRQMLAGLVTVAVSDAGDIKITGDAQGNDIDLDLGVGDLIVTGIAGTSISLNGVVAGQHQIDLGIDQSLDRDLRIRMRGGEDRVDILGLTVSRRLDVHLGRGDDFFSTESTVIEGQTNVKGGGGRFNDIIAFGASTVLDEDVFVATGPNRTGQGVELVLFDFMTVKGQITVAGASGPQFVRFFSSTLEGPVTLNTGSGNDQVRVEAIAALSLTQPFSANLGSGDDDITVCNMMLQSPFDCRLGGGNDVFRLVDSFIQDTTLFHGGAGTDQGTLDGNVYTVGLSLDSIEDLVVV